MSDNLQNSNKIACDDQSRVNVEGDKSKRTKVIVSKIANVVSFIVNIIILLVGALMIVVSVCGDKSQTGINIFGYTMMQVLSPSMQGELTEFDVSTMPANSIVIMKAIPEDVDDRKQFLDDLEVGDIITFLSLEGPSISEIVSHRIIDIEEIEFQGESTLYFTTRGDANPENVTESFTSQSVQGKIIWANENAGVIYGTLISSSMIIFLVVIPAAIMFVLELLKLINILNNAKMQKANQNSQSEIELLRKQIELLSQNANDVSAGVQSINDEQENNEHANGEQPDD